MSCPQCGREVVEEDGLIRCPGCGLRAVKDGFVINWGRRQLRGLRCPKCGCRATEDKFEEVK